MKQQAGEVQVAVRQIAWFELAGHRFENLNVGFAIGIARTLANPATTGNTGGGVLEPFRVVFDYSHSRIAFVKMQ